MRREVDEAEREEVGWKERGKEGREARRKAGCLEPGVAEGGRCGR